MAELVLNKDAGLLTLVGDLTFSTVPDVLAQEPQWSTLQGDTLEIDLAGVVRGDSAGLALLVAWLRAAKQHHKRMNFLNVPLQLREMAKVSGLEKLLPLS